MTYGSGTTDQDIYGYDPNTGRMSSFQFTVGASQTKLTGTLGWNPNGSLGSLGIVDQFNSKNTQNCTYTFDDLGRLAGKDSSGYSIDCGTGGWQQLVTLDAFGNISKSGSSSFAASYVASNGTTSNQEVSVAGCVPSYDARGNLTKDCVTNATYSWDNYGQLSAVNGVAVTFDALGREAQVGTSAEILYSPIGKLGVMNGQNNTSLRIPLPGGSTAELIGGAIHILHSDWLGSSRLSTNLGGRTMAYDVAYAPYGESYDSAGSASTDLDFTGLFQDTSAGLYDASYRNYNAVQGRWISPDPAGTNAIDPTNPQSWNRYAYALNNPLRFTDPTGLWCYYGTTGDNGNPDPFSDDIFDNKNYDYQTNKDECEGHGGSWQEDQPGSIMAPGESVTVTADPPLDTTQRLLCAVQFGQNHSIAAAFGAQNSFVGNLLGGNSVSGILNLGLFISGKKTPKASQLAAIPFKGAAQGIPVPPGKPGLSGAVGQLRGMAVKGVVAGVYNSFAGVGQETIELGLTESGQVATTAVQLGEETLGSAAYGVGIAKFAWDFGTVVYGYEFACK